MALTPRRANGAGAAGLLLALLTAACGVGLVAGGIRAPTNDAPHSWADALRKVPEAIEAETMLEEPGLVGAGRFEEVLEAAEGVGGAAQEETDQGAEDTEWFGAQAEAGAEDADDDEAQAEAEVGAEGEEQMPSEEHYSSEDLPELATCHGGSDGHGRRCRPPANEASGGGQLLSIAQPWWGKIAESPTNEEYYFDDAMEAQCADRSAPMPIRKLPLSLDPRIYQQTFLSQETCDQKHFGKWTTHSYDKAWEQICAMMQPRMRDIMPYIRRYRTCAVVGNNGNMIASNFGKEIDSHEAVFRLNKAPTKGFEKHVGSKMTFRFMNKRQFRAYSLEGHVGSHFEKIPEDSHGVIIVSRSPPDMMAQDIANAVKHAKQHKQNLKFTAMSMHIFSYANNLLDTYRQCASKRRKVGDFTSATSGLMTTVLSMHLCDHVTVYGIGDTSLARKNIPYQYFAVGGGWHSRREVNHHHNMSLEEEFIQALAHAGVIRHCQHSGCVGDPHA
mmetsp:Transcript_2009/g.5073  ORF Transcript_2009/g.5073 Transcript_2009/m.5073 type:complete len:501 (+) Transcript_2009:128-1630(+)